MAFTYYKNRGIRYNSLLLKSMFHDIRRNVFMEEEKKRTRGSKHLGKKKKFSQSNSNSAQTTLFAKPFDENKNARQLRWYRVGWLLVGLNLGFPLMISLRTTWARCELVVCQQKREGASLVFRMLKYYEKVNVSKEIHQSTARQARNKLYVKFRNTHY